MRILFVSEKDQCRGPMARVAAETLARREDLQDMVFDSCGLAAKGGEIAMMEVMGFLQREKLSLIHHRAKPFLMPLVDAADVVLVMNTPLLVKARATAGDYYAPKIVLYNEAVDMATKRMDIDEPNVQSTEQIRQTFAMLKAAAGRLVRTLGEPGCTPEILGARTIPRKLKPGSAGTGHRTSASTLDPAKRTFLSNLIFDMIERSYETQTVAHIQRALEQQGQPLSMLELAELLRQDLHGQLRMDKDGTWHVVSGATQHRKDRAKAAAKARAAQAEARQQAEQRQQAESSRATATVREEKLTMEEAFELLAVTPETERGDAQKKYRALLQRYHPDKFQDDPEFAEMASAKTRRLNEAWGMLKERFEG